MSTKVNSTVGGVGVWCLSGIVSNSFFLQWHWHHFIRYILIYCHPIAQMKYYSYLNWRWIEESSCESVSRWQWRRMTTWLIRLPIPIELLYTGFFVEKKQPNNGKVMYIYGSDHKLNQCSPRYWCVLYFKINKSCLAYLAGIFSIDEIWFSIHACY